MNYWLNIEEERRVNIIKDIESKTHLPPISIEKDWWVTMVLKALFTTPFANSLSFKGGTSLSKCWDIIQRFSEDVDIAIDREYLGFIGYLSKTQISDKLRRASCAFTREVLTDELEKQLVKLGIDKSLFSINVNVTSVTTTDPEIIEIHYKSLFADEGYIQNKVLVEVSGRSMREPKEKVRINSIISQTFPTASFTEKDFEIEAVSPKRTFLEKACLLHEEFQKPSNDIRVDRMSRHIYDLEKLMNTEIANEALADTELYKAVIEHREKFVGIKGFHYESLMPNSISFVPPNDIMPKWKDDYIKMQTSMIYGDSLTFENLIKRIKELNERFRDIDF